MAKGKKPAKGAAKAAPSRKRPYVSKYPSYPDLRTGELADESHFPESFESDGDIDAFHAALLRLFISNVRKGGPVAGWVSEFIADRFSMVLAGRAWDDIFSLPGRNLPDDWSPLSPTERRDFELYLLVGTTRHLHGTLTETLRFVAEQYPISFETVRAAYYHWKPRIQEFSKDSDEDLDSEGNAS